MTFASQHFGPLITSGAKTLNRTDWKIIPECCLPKLTKKNKTQGTKRRRRTIKVSLEDCQNPFHYLNMKNKLQPIQGTCNCTLRMGHTVKPHSLETKTIPDHLLLQTEKEVRSRYNKNSDVFEDTSGLDYKHAPSNSKKQLDIRQFVHVKTSADIAREEQDRKKRFKVDPILLLNK